jgi:hypothetical protein
MPERAGLSDAANTGTRPATPRAGRVIWFRVQPRRGPCSGDVRRDGGACLAQRGLAPRRRHRLGDRGMCSPLTVAHFAANHASQLGRWFSDR